jgi:hypothetical protein
MIEHHKTSQRVGGIYLRLWFVKDMFETTIKEELEGYVKQWICVIRT